MDLHTFPVGQRNSTRMSRRTLVRSLFAASAAGSIAAVLSGCTAFTPEELALDEPLASENLGQSESANAQIAFVKTADRIVGVQRAMALLDPTDWNGKQVLVKPNFNSADPAPGSTHPDVLQTVVASLHDGGAAGVTVVDRSGMGNTQSVFERLGVDEMVEAIGGQLRALDDLADEEWEMVDVPNSHWQQGFPFPRLVGNADVVVQLCCLKTHRYGGHFTLSLKNSVGLVAKYRPGDNYNYMNELHTSPHQRTMIAEINAAYTPDLVILDGVEAFVRGGPARGDRVAANVMLAGSDRVALDAVGVALLRHFGTTSEVSHGPIFEQEQIARAVELGLGVAGPDQIELVTDDPESQAFATEINAILHDG